jgi:hypothetical protein
MKKNPKDSSGVPSKAPPEPRSVPAPTGVSDAPGKAKRSADEIRSSIEKTLAEVQGRLDEKKAELRAIIEAAKRDDISSSEISKMPLEGRLKALEDRSNAIKETREKLSRAGKSLKTWRDLYRDTQALSDKAKEALVKSEEWRAKAAKTDKSAIAQNWARPPSGRPSSPPTEKIPEKMRRKTTAPEQQPEPQDEKPSRKQ